MSLTLEEARKALRYADWTSLHSDGVDGKFAVLLNGEAVTATVVSVETSDDPDSYYDNTMTVIVKLGEQFYRVTGEAQDGSHCYGDYEPSWNSPEEVQPVPQYVTVYERV